MQSVSPVRFAEIRPFADMAAVVSGGVSAIVTLEHSDQRSRVSPTEPPIEAAVLRIWTAADGARALHEVARWTAPLPVPSEMAMTVQDGQLIALAQVNQSKAAYLLSTAWPTLPPESSIVPFTVIAPVGLDAALAARVHIDPRADWSTFGLAPRAWLFHPSVTGGPHGAISLAMNAADGHAVVWRRAVRDGAVQLRQVALVPAALDPVLLRVEGRDYLFYRAMPAGWSVFFHDLRYSRQFGPAALPLMMAELDAGGTVVRTIDLSAAAGVGPVFEFAVQTMPSSLVLAAVASSAGQPDLRLFVTSPAGAAPQLRHEGLLRAVPLRLTMSAIDGVALVGLAYQNSGIYALDALSVVLR
jgi:hypothetical protein